MGMQAAERGEDMEASGWWSASEAAYLQLCGSKEDFVRDRVFLLNLGGQVEGGKILHGEEEMVEEGRRVVEKIVVHRCGLAQRKTTTLDFLWKLADSFTSHRPELSVYVYRQRVDLLIPMGASYNSYLADSFNNLGFYLSKLERWEEAIEPMQAAVTLRRTLFAQHPSIYQPYLANSLHDLGYFHSECRRWKDAMEFTKEALELRQALVADNPEGYNIDFAWSLHNQGNFLYELKQLKEAAELMKKAVEVRQLLYAKIPDTFRVDLAWSFHQLALFQSKLKNWEAAAEAAEQAVKLRQDLFSADATKYGPNLADSLIALASYRGRLKEWAKAADAAGRSTSLLEELYTQDPGQRGFLVWSLHSLEFYLSEAGSQQMAATVMKNIMNMRQKLMQGDAETHRSLASCVNDFGWELREFGRPEKGLTYAEDAITIIRATQSMEQPMMMDCLACSLDTAATCLHDLGRPGEALTYGEEAVSLSRSLYERDPADNWYRKNFVGNMKRHAKVLGTLARTGDAEKIVQQIAIIQAINP